MVEHLGELRSRIIVSLLVLTAAFAVCFWQNNWILDLLNEPLGKRRPLTLGVTEPFFTTFTVCFYGALIISLPVLLYQAYAYLAPAFSPENRRIARPFLCMVPVLFLLGVAFSYTIVLPQAIKFLLGFNAAEFDIELRAKDYYGFASLSMFAVGILFQIPVAMLASIRLGLIEAATYRRQRRYAVLVIAVLAMLLPGQDPITMIICMLPLLLLYELSLIIASILPDTKPTTGAQKEKTKGSSPEETGRTEPIEYEITDDGDKASDESSPGRV